MKTIWISLLSLATLISTLITGDEQQRSKETNCLIAGYQNCILHHSGGKNETNRTELLKNSAVDCWKISRSNDKTSLSPTCADNQCAWGGQCVSSLIDEHDGRHTTEDLPIWAFYDDARTITISFPTYLDAILYVLESRQLSKNGKKEMWKFAGVSNQTSISHRILDICQKYEFRPTAILNNGTVISFLPKSTTANPPDFIVDTLKMEKLYYDDVKQKVISVFVWKTPYGYSSKDVISYENYLHTSQCDLSGEYTIPKQMNRTEDGGILTIEFTENLLRQKCQFLLSVWATNSCGSKTAVDAKADFELNCARVDNYYCPQSELKPKCMSHVSVSILSYDGVSKALNLNLSWSPPEGNVPEYYHVKWGPAQLVDEPNKFPAPPPPPPSSSDGLVPNFDPFQPTRIHRVPTNTPDFESNIWLLKKDLIKNEKVNGDVNNFTLQHVQLDHEYGVQICAIFNADFKTPDWPVVPVSPFACLCTGAQCEYGGNIKCQSPNLFQLDKEHSTESATSQPTTKTVPKTVMKNSDLEHVTSIGPVKDFVQTLIGWEYTGLRMTLNWNPPSGVSQDDISEYRLTLESLRDCNLTKVCCEFARFPSLTHSEKNSSQISMLISKDVLRANCQLMVKITTVTVNGVQSVSLKNIVVPKPVVDVDFHEKSATVEQSGSIKSANFTIASIEDFSDESAETNGSEKLSSFNENSGAPVLLPSKQISVESRHLGGRCIEMGCSHFCSDTDCLCPLYLKLLSDNKTCEAETELSMLNMPPQKLAIKTSRNSTNTPKIPKMSRRCRHLGCQYLCDEQVVKCICPAVMDLGSDGKSCSYRDPDPKNVTFPPQPLTTAILNEPRIYCLKSESEITVQYFDNNITIAWENQSWSERRLKNNISSIVFIRWGQIKSVQNMPFNRVIINESAPSKTELSNGRLSITYGNSTKQLGFQLCVTDERGLSDWDFYSILLLKPPKDLQDAYANTQMIEDDSNVKKLIVLAVVIPLCCIIIIVSLTILFCHFYPSSFRRLCADGCAKKLSTIRQSNSVASTTNPNLSTGDLNRGNKSIDSHSCNISEQTCGSTALNGQCNYYSERIHN